MKKLFLSLLFIGTLSLQAQVLPLLNFVEIASGLNEPVDITHAGDDRLFIVEQSGRIMIVDTSGKVLSTPFLDIRQRVRDSRNEQGLLGLAFHPNYTNNGYFYVNYTDNSGDTQVSRFSRDANNSNLGDPNSEVKLMSINQPFSNHNGGQVAFGPDGYLYIATGDGGSGGDPLNHSQNRQSLLGKMLRIDVNSGSPYSIPADNPFVNDPTTLNEIWAIGLRNPWRFSFDALNGDMWIGDVGQDDAEEISRQPGGSLGGENYGWRCREGNGYYNVIGCTGPFTAPVYEYHHPPFTDQSVTGGYVYRGQDHPGMYGFYFFADYEAGDFWIIYSDSLMGFPISHGNVSLFGQGLSTFGVDYRNELYFANHTAGKIYQIVDKRTSIEVENLSEIAQISPNPFEEKLRIQFKTPRPEVEITLFDLSGREVYRELAQNKREMWVTRGDLSQGVYVLEIRTGGKAFRGKVVAR